MRRELREEIISFAVSGWRQPRRERPVEDFDDFPEGPVVEPEDEDSEDT